MGHVEIFLMIKNYLFEKCWYLGIFLLFYVFPVFKIVVNTAF